MADGNKGALALVVLMKIFIYGGTHLLAEANGKKIADIYWNTTNQIFYFDNNRHIITVRILDSVDIICPKYQHGFREEWMEYSVIYMVDARSYETCSLDMRYAQRVGLCMQPHQDQVITVVFREFTPLPGGLEFRPNKTYYIISTSDGSKSGLNNDRGGLCGTYNMRLKFLVKPRCRTKSAAVSDDSRQEDDDCSEMERTKEIQQSPSLWEVNVQPPPFPRQPFIWPNSYQPGQAPKDLRRFTGTPRSLALSNHFPSIWSIWVLVLVISFGLVISNRLTRRISG